MIGMEGVEGEGSGGGGGQRYSLKASRINNEDILMCVDVDPQCLVEMKFSGANGRPLTRLDSIRQAIVLFVNAKLAINPEHRFAFATLSNSISWLRKEFSSEIESTIAAVRALSATSSTTSQPDLTNLFRLAAHEAKKSRMQGRILRVILFYCRSNIRPQHQWPVNQKVFTLDVMYLHDKPGPDNCPQEVYDTLVEALEHVSEYEGYILESGQGLARVLFRHVLVLLSHPQQRCIQEYLDMPKSLTKKAPQPEPMATEDSVPGSSQ